MTEESGSGGGLTLLLIPEDGGESRTFRIGPSTIRVAKGGAVAAALILVVLLASWGMIATRAARVGALEAEADSLRSEVVRLREVGGKVAELEREYSRILSLLGAGAAQPSDLWLPPVGASPGASEPRRDEDTPPATWPLSERGFVTQALVEAPGGIHPGIDIAVPSGTYIRAAGRGTVDAVGEDPVYGRVALIQHQNGYSTRYAHASLLLVSRGDSVRAGEVIGLTGSTGRSTAPHLHFEVEKDGTPVDPLSLVRQPG